MPSTLPPSRRARGAVGRPSSTASRPPRSAVFAIARKGVAPAKPAAPVTRQAAGCQPWAAREARRCIVIPCTARSGRSKGDAIGHGNCRRVHCRCMTSGSLSARKILANMARATDGVERLSNHKISLGLLIGQAHGGHPAAWLHPGHQRRRLDGHQLLPHPRPDCRAGTLRPVLHRRYAGGAHGQPARLEPLPDVHERARAGDAAHRTGGRHDAHRPGRHRIDEFLRALQRRPPIRLAGPHLGRTSGLERRHLRQRLRRAQFRPCQPAAACAALRKGQRVRRRGERAVEQLGRRRLHSRPQPADCSSTRRASMPSTTRASSSRSTAPSTSPVRRKAIR